jgi:putative SOS response-associated peptidase YedK
LMRQAGLRRGGIGLPGPVAGACRGRLVAMCGRYAITRPKDKLTGLFKIDDGMAADVSRQDYNVAPSKKAPVVLARAADEESNGPAVRQLRMLRWGMVPFWAKDAKRASANARAETVHEKPTFRGAFAKRRLLVPVDGFYEWFAKTAPDGKTFKQPYYLRVDCTIVT